MTLKCVRLFLALSLGALRLSAADAVHPLDPLGKGEIAAAVEILKAGGKVSEASRFPMIALHEPPMDEVLNYRAGGPIRRQAFAVVYERAANKTFEAVVDLNGRRIISFKEVPGVQAPMLLEDYILMQEIVRADPQWQEAMRKRGITDFQGVQLDPWSAGYFGFPEEEGRRIFRAVPHYKGGTKNAYARPIEGVVAFVDVSARKVLKLVDTGVVPVANATNDLDVKSVGPSRSKSRSRMA
jgi:primary-amine oxidase